jgi:hypothetical protein
MMVNSITEVRLPMALTRQSQPRFAPWARRGAHAAGYGDWEALSRWKGYMYLPDGPGPGIRLRLDVVTRPDATCQRSGRQSDPGAAKTCSRASS